MSSLLDRVVEQVAIAPHSAASLTLYALISTLEFEQAGYLFKLAKLRDLSPAQRQLAYELIESVVAGDEHEPAWQQAKEKVDALVRAG